MANRQMIYKDQYTDDYLNAKRKSGDVNADRFIQKEFSFEIKKIALQHWLASLSYNAQLNSLPVSYVYQEPICKSNVLPVWASKKLMQEGAAFFAQHADAIMSLLGLLSLPYCYAAADGAMVLYLSERLKSDIAKRLYETGIFVWDVMSPDAFQEKGKGFSSILKVRLIHAAARYYTLNSRQWNNDWGLPINQEDMAGTNLSFSLIVIRGLRKLGFSISESDQQAFMHLWKVIGYLLGLDESLLPSTAKQAQLLEAAIRLRQFKLSAHGQSLTLSLTDLLTGVNGDASYSKKEVLGLMHYLLGNEVSQMLNINEPELPSGKLRVLKTINLMNDLKVNGNAVTAYRDAYDKFKRYKMV